MMGIKKTIFSWDTIFALTGILIIVNSYFFAVEFGYKRIFVFSGIIAVCCLMLIFPALFRLSRWLNKIKIQS
jgi:hypothetical protein